MPRAGERRQQVVGGAGDEIADPQTVPGPLGQKLHIELSGSSSRQREPALTGKVAETAHRAIGVGPELHS